MEQEQGKTLGEESDKRDLAEDLYEQYGILPLQLQMELTPEEIEEAKRRIRRSRNIYNRSFDKRRLVNEIKSRRSLPQLPELPQTPEQWLGNIFKKGAQGIGRAFDPRQGPDRGPSVFDHLLEGATGEGGGQLPGGVPPFSPIPGLGPSPERGGQLPPIRSGVPLPPPLEELR
jgi:hypothetical protein